MSENHIGQRIADTHRRHLLVTKVAVRYQWLRVERRLVADHAHIVADTSAPIVALT